MKVAICYSGQLRTGLKALENQRLFIDVAADYFLHTWTHNTNKRFVINGAEATEVPANIISAYVAQLKPKAYYVEDPTVLNMHGTNLAWKGLYYSWLKSLEYRRQYEAALGIKYDVVVKMRPDIIFKPGRKLSAVIKQALRENAFILENGLWNPPYSTVVDDVFWAAPTKIMDIASEYYWHLPEHTADPGGGLGAFLTQRDIAIGRVPDGCYSILRAEADHLSPVADFDKCFELERELYHTIPVANPSGSPAFYR